MEHNDIYSAVVRLNTQDAQDKLEKLNKSVERLQRQKQKALTKGDTEKVAELNKEIRRTEALIKSTQTQTENVKRAFKNMSESSMKDLLKLRDTLKNLMNSGDVPRGTKQWNELQRKLREVNTEIAGIRNESRAASSSIGGYALSLSKMWGAIDIAKNGFKTVVSAISEYTDAFVQLDTAMADVRKYTNQTAEEVESMNEKLREMDTRTSIIALNELAGAAGRLGMSAEEDILEFVEAADKINVALGDDLGEGAVDAIGKLAMAFGEDNRLGLRGAMLATGSAINELAANSAANAGYLVEFESRLAGVGNQAGLTQAQILGFGAVLDESMQKDEKSATALQKIITEMSVDASKFAKAAGLDVKEFAELVENDLNAALMKFFTAMRDKGGFTELAPLLKELGLSGSGATAVLSQLASQIDRVAEMQAKATDAYEQGTSVIEEFNEQNNTEEAVMQKVENEIFTMKAALGKELLPVKKAALKVTMTFLDVLKLLPAILKTVAVFVKDHAATLATLAISVIAATVAFNAHTIAMKAQATWTAAVTALQTAQTAVVNTCRNAWVVFNATLRANPIGAIVTVVGLLVTALVSLFEHTERNTEAQSAQAKELENVRKAKERLAQVTAKAKADAQEEASKIQLLNEAVHNNKLAYEDRLAALNELKKIVPEYHAELTKEGALIRDNTEAITEYCNKLIMQATIKAFADDIARINKEIAELEEQGKRINTSLDASKKWKSHFEDKQKGEDRPTSKYRSGTGQVYEISEPSKYTAEINRQATAVATHTARLKANTDALAERRKQLELTQAALQATMAKNPGAIDGLIGGSGGNGGGGNGGNSGKTAGGTGGNGGSGSGRGAKEDAAAKAAEERRKKELAELQQRYTEIKAIEEEFYARGLEDEAEYNENMRQIQMDYLTDRLRVLQENNASEEEITQTRRDIANEAERQIIALIKEEAKERERIEKEEAERAERERKEQAEQDAAIAQQVSELRKRFLEEDTEATKDALRRQVQFLLEAEAITAQEAEKMLAAIEKIGEKAKEPLIDTNVLEGPAAEIGKMINSIDGLHTKLVEGQATWQDWGAAAANAMQASVSIMSSLSSYYSAAKDAETQKISQEYDKQIAAAGKNKKQQQKLEEEKEKKVAAVKNKYQKKINAMQIAMAIADGGQAVIKAMTGVPWPLNLVASAITAAQVALQIATIKKQQQAQTGYYEGGYTGGRRYRKEAGVVHEGEFVGNHLAVQNPTVRPVFDLIDQAQRNNTIGRLDLPAAMGAGGQATVVAPVVNVTSDNSELQDAIQQMNLAISALNTRLDEGIDAKVYTDGEYGVAKALKKHNQLIQNAR